MHMWATRTRNSRIREGLDLLLAQAVIDGYTVNEDDEHPYRVTLPVGIVPLTEHQAAHFISGAVTAYLGPLARKTPGTTTGTGR